MPQCTGKDAVGCVFPVRQSRDHHPYLLLVHGMLASIAISRYFCSKCRWVAPPGNSLSKNVHTLTAYENYIKQEVSSIFQHEIISQGGIRHNLLSELGNAIINERVGFWICIRLGCYWRTGTAIPYGLENQVGIWLAGACHVNTLGGPIRQECFFVAFRKVREKPAPLTRAT